MKSIQFTSLIVSLQELLTKNTDERNSFWPICDATTATAIT